MTYRKAIPETVISSISLYFTAVISWSFRCLRITEVKSPKKEHVLHLPVPSYRWKPNKFLLQENEKQLILCSWWMWPKREKPLSYGLSPWMLSGSGSAPPPPTCSNLGSPMTPGVLHDACEPSGSRRNWNLWSVIWMLVTLPYTESEKRSSSLHRVILSCPDPTWLAQIPHPPSWPDNTCAMHFPGDSEATQHTREKIMYFIRITLFFP